MRNKRVAEKVLVAVRKQLRLPCQYIRDTLEAYDLEIGDIISMVEEDLPENDLKTIKLAIEIAQEDRNFCW